MFAMRSDEKSGQGLVDAAREAIKGNFVTSEEKEKRLEICRKPCVYLGNVLGVEVCNVCGCPLSTRTSFLNIKCPKGLW